MLRQMAHRAVRVPAYGASSVLRVETVPTPTPGPDEVRVRVHAVGVNPVDTYIRSGVHAVKPPLPYTPGRDLAGVVEAVGAEAAATHRVGDRVYATTVVTGAYAEQALVKAVNAYRLPAKLSFEQGACLGVPYFTAHRALVVKANAQMGETVFIHGASGGVGTAAIQLARARGLRVIGSAGSPAGLDLVRAQGAHEVVDHRQPDHMEHVKALTDGKGPQIILEMLANENLGADLKLAANFGRVIVVGSRGLTTVDPRDIMLRELTVTAVFMFHATQEEMTATAKALEEDIEAGHVNPVVGRTFPLEQAAAAHDLVVPPPGQPAPGTVGQVVLVP